MFSYDRHLYFRETDAAGVVYFSEVLNLCHEVYEASLRRAGIDLKLFFSAQGSTIVPIVHAEVDFFKPLYCGDRVWVDLTLNDSEPPNPSTTTPSTQFELAYTLYTTAERNDRPVAQAKTGHVCLNAATRRREDYREHLGEWMLLLVSSEVFS
ncbi:MAG: acyl-CoA thioesterase [Prochlorotrichaceae cyanobacterium]